MVMIMVNICGSDKVNYHLYWISQVKVGSQHLWENKFESHVHENSIVKTSMKHSAYISKSNVESLIRYDGEIYLAYKMWRKRK